MQQHLKSKSDGNELRQNARILRNSRTVLVRNLQGLYWSGVALIVIFTAFFLVSFARQPNMFLGASITPFLAALTVLIVGFGFFQHRAAQAYRDPTHREPFFIGLTIFGAIFLAAVAHHPLVFGYAVCSAPIMARMRQRYTDAILLGWVGVNVVLVLFLWGRPDFWYLPLIAGGFQMTALLFASTLLREWRSVEKLSRLNRDLGSTRELLQSVGAVLEKNRIARELHDVTGHKLTAAKLQLELLEDDAIDTAQKERTSAVKAMVVDLMRDLRHLIVDVDQDASIDLSESIRILADSLPEGLCDVKLEPVDGLKSDQAQTLLRVAQEGVTNALRHAHATSLSIALEQTSDAVILAIEDDGRGFDLANARKGGGLGLRTMDDRMTALGGKFVVHAKTGEGTRLMAALPMGNPHVA